MAFGPSEELRQRIRQLVCASGEADPDEMYGNLVAYWTAHWWESPTGELWDGPSDREVLEYVLIYIKERYYFRPEEQWRTSPLYRVQKKWQKSSRAVDAKQPFSINSTGEEKETR